MVRYIVLFSYTNPALLYPSRNWRPSKLILKVLGGATRWKGGNSLWISSRILKLTGEHQPTGQFPLQKSAYANGLCLEAISWRERGESNKYDNSEAFEGPRVNLAQACALGTQQVSSSSVTSSCAETNKKIHSEIREVLPVLLALTCGCNGSPEPGTKAGKGISNKQNQNQIRNFAMRCTSYPPPSP